MNPKKLKTIVKNAKAKAFNENIEAFALFQILSNIGGEFGLIMRHRIDEYGDIDQVPSRKAYKYMNWLPSDLYKELISLAENGLVRASFITNKTYSDKYGQHYHIVCCCTKRTLIQTKVRNWLKTKQAKVYIKNDGHRKDSITDFHFI